MTASPRKFFNGAAADIAGQKIAPRVAAGGVTAQRGLHHIQRFEEFREIDVGESAQAVEGIRDGETFRGLTTMFGANQVRQRLAQLCFEPLPRRHQCAFLVLQLLGKASDEIGLQGHRLALQQSQHPRKALSTRARGGSKAVRPKVRGFAEFLFLPDALRQTGQRLDQREAQHHGEDPEFRDRERRFQLVLTDRVDQNLFGERIVGPADGAAGEFADMQVTVGSREPRKHAAKTGRQRTADIADTSP